jgi:hypothetical protein
MGSSEERTCEREAEEFSPLGRCQGTAGEDAAGWKMLSGVVVICGD